MRVLFASTAGAGHLGPLLPFAGACLDAGHEVLVAGPQSLESSVERLGHRFWGCADTPPEEWGAIMARLGTLSQDEANRVVIGEVFAGLDARTVLPRMQQAMNEWKPDVVVRETAEFGSAVAAEKAGIPQARVAIGLGASEAWMLAVATEHLAALREEHGLPGDPGGKSIKATPYLTLVPPALEDPRNPGPKDAHRFQDVAAAATDLPDWWPGNEDPLVYVTFGSVAPGMPGIGDLYRGVLGALSGLPVRILATVGQETDPASMPSPPNVHVERWIPQGEVLPHVSAGVCHGGFGSVHGALTHGVPLVVVPFFADQPINAQRVAELGAGLEVAPPDPGAVAEALLRVLEDDSYTLAAEQVAEDYRNLPPIGEAVRLMERLGTPA